MPRDARRQKAHFAIKVVRKDNLGHVIRHQEDFVISLASTHHFLGGR